MEALVVDTRPGLVIILLAAWVIGTSTGMVSVGLTGEMAGILAETLTEVRTTVVVAVLASEGIVNIVDLWPCAVFETDPAIGLRADMTVEL